MQSGETQCKKEGLLVQSRGNSMEKERFGAEQSKNSMEKEGFGAEQSDMPCQGRCPGTRQMMPSKAEPLAWCGRALPLSRLQLCHIKHNELLVSSGGIRHYNNMNNK